jgi:ACR3 family arsenite efflux pump ArsB
MAPLFTIFTVFSLTGGAILRSGMSPRIARPLYFGIQFLIRLALARLIKADHPYSTAGNNFDL